MAMIKSGAAFVDRSSRPRPPSIDRLRASPEVEEMLDWFFTRAARDIGMGSNFDMLAQMAKMGISSGDPDANESRLDRVRHAVHEYRKVRAVLSLLHAEDYQVLDARYEDRQWPVELVQAFGRSTGVAVRTPVARRLYLRDSEKKRARWESVSVWLCGVVRRCERETLAQVRAATESLEGHAFAAVTSAIAVTGYAKAS
jgi:hypothetical protein